MGVSALLRLCVVEGAGTIARGRIPVGILGLHLHSHHARAREGGAQGLGREFVVRVGNSCPPRKKTKIWNAAGEKPPGCDQLERTAAVADPTAVVWLTVAPTSRETTIPSHLFRVILLRRLRQALPLSVRNCRCGLPLDFSGHHRAACARAGMLGRRGYALECGRKDLSRGWWTGPNQHLRQGHGFGCSSERRAQIGGGG